MDLLKDKMLVGVAIATSPMKSTWSGRGYRNTVRNWRRMRPETRPAISFYTGHETKWILSALREWYKNL